MPRLFVGIPCVPEAADAIGAWQGELRRQAGRVSWVQPGNFHLTLRFLGEIPEARLEAARRALAEAAGKAVPFRLELVGAGLFPRVIWVGARGEGLLELAAHVEGAYRDQGFGEADKPFKPHLTIGRIRDGLPPPALKSAVAAHAATTWAAWQVAEAVLIESRLDPRGSIYTPLLRAGLGHG